MRSLPTFILLSLMLLLAGCGTTPYRPGPSPCGADPGGRDCEIERYLNVP